MKKIKTKFKFNFFNNYSKQLKQWSLKFIQKKRKLKFQQLVIIFSIYIIELLNII